MFILFFSLLYAQTPSVPDSEVNLEIIVESRKGFEVYVAPVQYHVYDNSIEAIIPHDSVFMYASQHTRLAMAKNGHIYEPVSMLGGIKTYNKDTISYVWEDCNYIRDYRDCSYKNDHYFLETHVTVDKNEIVITMSLFNSDLQIIGSSIATNEKLTKWIKQQEEIINNSLESNNTDTRYQNCYGDICDNIPIKPDIQNTTTIKKKEEAPLKIDVPPKLLSSMINQASLGLWIGVKIN